MQNKYHEWNDLYLLLTLCNNKLRLMELPSRKSDVTWHMYPNAFQPTSFYTYYYYYYFYWHLQPVLILPLSLLCTETQQFQWSYLCYHFMSIFQLINLFSAHNQQPSMKSNRSIQSKGELLDFQRRNSFNYCRKRKFI